MAICLLLLPEPLADPAVSKWQSQELTSAFQDRLLRLDREVVEHCSEKLLGTQADRRWHQLQILFTMPRASLGDGGMERQSLHGGISDILHLTGREVWKGPVSTCLPRNLRREGGAGRGS